MLYQDLPRNVTIVFFVGANNNICLLESPKNGKERRTGDRVVLGGLTLPSPPFDTSQENPKKGEGNGVALQGTGFANFYNLRSPAIEVFTATKSSSW